MRGRKGRRVPGNRAGASETRAHRRHGRRSRRKAGVWRSARAAHLLESRGGVDALPVVGAIGAVLTVVGAVHESHGAALPAAVYCAVY